MKKMNGKNINKVVEVVTPYVETFTCKEKGT